MKDIRVRLLRRQPRPPPLAAEERSSCYRCAARPSPRLGVVWDALKAAGPKGLTKSELRAVTGVRGAAQVVSELRIRWEVPILAESLGRRGTGGWEWRYWISDEKGGDK